MTDGVVDSSTPARELVLLQGVGLTGAAIGAVVFDDQRYAKIQKAHHRQLDNIDGGMRFQRGSE